MFGWCVDDVKLEDLAVADASEPAVGEKPTSTAEHGPVDSVDAAAAAAAVAPSVERSQNSPTMTAAVSSEHVASSSAGHETDSIRAADKPAEDDANKVQWATSLFDLT